MSVVTRRVTALNTATSGRSARSTCEIGRATRRLHREAFESADDASVAPQNALPVEAVNESGQPGGDV